MVFVTGAAAATVACPLVPLLGAAGANAAAGATITGAAAIGMPGASAGAAVLALGEGAFVGVGSIAGGFSSSAGIALATAAGPVGWLVVGCSDIDYQSGDKGYTWDCWKPIIRDKSTQPSCGITLRRLAAHPNVRSISLDKAGFLVENTFGECFRLTPVDVEGRLALHASGLSS